MESQAEILKQLENFIQKHPQESERLLPFTQFLQAFKGEQLFDRKNFNGHITSSAFIINRKKKTLLLLKHKALNRWLQPGGHVDVSDENLMAAALREAVEETGIPNQSLHPVFDSVFDFDSHIIPENTRKQEPQHYHHDVRFLFECSADQTVTIAEEESTGSSWISFEDLNDSADFKKVVKRINKVMDQEVSSKQILTQ